MKNLYLQLLSRLLKVNKHNGMKLGLTNSLKLNTVLGNPAQAYPAVHVAGTNGKGSVVTKIATALQADGLRVGLYTSPHIACFRERIRTNGQMISEDDLERILSRIFAIIDHEGIPATYFEIATLLAFTYFAEQKIDIAVVETGLGGRLDATNIVSTKLVVITSISLDHTDILGNNLEEIAYEKAGIIKPNVPVVLGPRLPHSLFEKIARENGSPCIRVLGEFNDFYAENEAIAKAALEVMNVSSEAIERGLKALPSCRLETFYKDQLPKNLGKNFPQAIVLDVGHNPDGLTQMLKTIDQRYPDCYLRLVVGLSANKDVRSCLEVIVGTEAVVHFHLVESTNGRAAPKEELKQHLLELDVNENKISCENSVAEAIENTCRQVKSENEIIIVCGTFFIMAAARKALGIDEPSDPEDLNER